MSGRKEVVLTSSLFVANIPLGTSEEAFSDLFERFGGFQSARLRQDRYGKVVGFADFDDVDCSTQAREALDGQRLNEDVDEDALIVQYTKSRSQRSYNQQRRQQQEKTNNTYNSQTNNTALPDNANSTLFVDGVPDDATERELAHIFRPYAGFQSVRLPSSGGRQLCFVVYGTAHQATVAKNSLQGYAMESTGGSHLYLDYAKRRNDRHKGRGRHNNSDSE